jgi:hypothetical protein
MKSWNALHEISCHILWRYLLFNKHAWPLTLLSPLTCKFSLFQSLSIDYKYIEKAFNTKAFWRIRPEVSVFRLIDRYWIALHQLQELACVESDASVSSVDFEAF